MGEANAKPARILLLTHARTASHVLERMLSKQPNCIYGSHFFVPARQLRRDILNEKLSSDHDSPISKQLLATLNDCYHKQEEFFIQAETQGQTAFVHTQPHAMLSPALDKKYAYGTTPTQADFDFWLVGQAGKPHTNPTVLPDEAFLQPGTKPIITFRHPLLMVEGLWRGMTSNSAYVDDTERIALYMKRSATLAWMRMMYDFYMEHGAAHGIAPVLVDADDYLGPEKEAVMKELCEQTGLDASRVIYTWPKATEEEIAAMPLHVAQARLTLSASDGILPGYDSRGRNIDTEMISWRAKHGEEAARLIRELVENAMPDYEYLRERRLKPYV